jgi:hypothetical protein
VNDDNIIVPVVIVLVIIVHETIGDLVTKFSCNLRPNMTKY